MKMWTNSKGVSYYTRGKKYYKNTGWLEREITKEEYKKDIEKIEKLEKIPMPQISLFDYYKNTKKEKINGYLNKY